LYIPQKDLPVGNQWSLIAELGALPGDILLTKKDYITQKMKLTEEFLSSIPQTETGYANCVDEPLRFSYELFGERSFIQLAEFLGAEPV